LRQDKITIALLWSKYCGRVTSVNDLVLELDKNYFKVFFIYLSGHGTSTNMLEEAGYDVFYLSQRKRINTFSFSTLFRLVRLLKRQKVTVLHCHGHKPMFYGVPASMIAKTPVVIGHVHGLGRSRNFRRKLENFLLFKKVNRIITVANGVKEDVLKNNWSLSAEKLFVLENSIDYKRFGDVPVIREYTKKMLNLPRDAFVFGTVGRFAPTKGLSYLIGAFEKVKEKIPKAHLLLLGSGLLRAELEQQAANTSYEESIHFVGYRENIEELLRAMDVFVLSSVAEGMPRVILEAMAAGIPCIATEVGGVSEVINGDGVGFLVPPADPNALAQAMIKVAKMPKNSLDRLTQNAQSRVRQFYSHDIVREKLRELYESEFEARVKINED
jgi:glycosyltransferase involved in cell wall biosynthesis